MLNSYSLNHVIKNLQELNYRLTYAPVLTLPEGSDGFLIYCDASRLGWVAF
ncbi:hypothetical protein MTR67_001894 [Solanum verrucosum]|uniref:Reverse transcriptase/retrotransposon-derived protein RNase H-like domain-containing protein n=1 Tax=Solanum verrucosum TaxID=315347 RepID=A0AAF0PV56_SOLVR|nr:hypothetical protein MTR67_001894 [Solanum verrucosum]